MPECLRRHPEVRQLVRVEVPPLPSVRCRTSSSPITLEPAEARDVADGGDTLARQEVLVDDNTIIQRESGSSSHSNVRQPRLALRSPRRRVVGSPTSNEPRILGAVFNVANGAGRCAQFDIRVRGESLEPRRGRRDRRTPMSGRCSASRTIGTKPRLFSWVATSAPMKPTADDDDHAARFKSVEFEAHAQLRHRGCEA